MVGIFVFHCERVTMCERVSVSARMNSHSVTECRPWRSRTDEMIQKQSIVLALITSVGSTGNIISGSGWWSKITEPGPSFPVAKQSPLKETKESRLNVLLSKQSTCRGKKGGNNICLESLSFISWYDSYFLLFIFSEHHWVHGDICHIWDSSSVLFHISFARWVHGCFWVTCNGKCLAGQINRGLLSPAAHMEPSRHHFTSFSMVFNVVVLTNVFRMFASKWASDWIIVWTNQTLLIHDFNGHSFSKCSYC